MNSITFTSHQHEKLFGSLNDNIIDFMDNNLYNASSMDKLLNSNLKYIIEPELKEEFFGFYVTSRLKLNPSIHKERSWNENDIESLKKSSVVKITDENLLMIKTREDELFGNMYQSQNVENLQTNNYDNKEKNLNEDNDYLHEGLNMLQHEKSMEGPQLDHEKSVDVHQVDLHPQDKSVDMNQEEQEVQDIVKTFMSEIIKTAQDEYNEEMKNEENNLSKRKHEDKSGVDIDNDINQQEKNIDDNHDQEDVNENNKELIATILQPKNEEKYDSGKEDEYDQEHVDLNDLNKQHDDIKQDNEERHDDENKNENEDENIKPEDKKEQEKVDNNEENVNKSKDLELKHEENNKEDITEKNEHLLNEEHKSELNNDEQSQQEHAENKADEPSDQEIRQSETKEQDNIKPNLDQEIHNKESDRKDMDDEKLDAEHEKKDTHENELNEKNDEQEEKDIHEKNQDDIHENEVIIVNDKHSENIQDEGDKNTLLNENINNEEQNKEEHIGKTHVDDTNNIGLNEEKAVKKINEDDQDPQVDNIEKEKEVSLEKNQEEDGKDNHKADTDNDIKHENSLNRKEDSQVDEYEQHDIEKTQTEQNKKGDEDIIPKTNNEDITDAKNKVHDEKNTLEKPDNETHLLEGENNLDDRVNEDNRVDHGLNSTKNKDVEDMNNEKKDANNEKERLMKTIEPKEPDTNEQIKHEMKSQKSMDDDNNQHETNQKFDKRPTRDDYELKTPTILMLNTESNERGTDESMIVNDKKILPTNDSGYKGGDDENEDEDKLKDKKEILKDSLGKVDSNKNILDDEKNDKLIKNEDDNKFLYQKKDTKAQEEEKKEIKVNSSLDNIRSNPKDNEKSPAIAIIIDKSNDHDKADNKDKPSSDDKVNWKKDKETELKKVEAINKRNDLMEYNNHAMPENTIIKQTPKFHESENNLISTELPNNHQIVDQKAQATNSNNDQAKIQDNEKSKNKISNKNIDPSLNTDQQTQATNTKDDQAKIQANEKLSNKRISPTAEDLTKVTNGVEPIIIVENKKKEESIQKDKDNDKIEESGNKLSELKKGENSQANLKNIKESDGNPAILNKSSSKPIVKSETHNDLNQNEKGIVLNSSIDKDKEKIAKIQGDIINNQKLKLEQKEDTLKISGEGPAEKDIVSKDNASKNNNLGNSITNSSKEIIVEQKKPSKDSNAVESSQDNLLKIKDNVIHNVKEGESTKLIKPNEKNAANASEQKLEEKVIPPQNDQKKPPRFSEEDKSKKISSIKSFEKMNDLESKGTNKVDSQLSEKHHIEQIEIPENKKDIKDEEKDSQNPKDSNNTGINNNSGNISKLRKSLKLDIASVLQQKSEDKMPELIKEDNSKNQSEKFLNGNRKIDRGSENDRSNSEASSQRSNQSKDLKQQKYSNSYQEIHEDMDNHNNKPNEDDNTQKPIKHNKSIKIVRRSFNAETLPLKQKGEEGKIGIIPSSRKSLKSGTNEGPITYSKSTSNVRENFNLEANKIGPQRKDEVISQENKMNQVEEEKIQKELLIKKLSNSRDLGNNKEVKTCDQNNDKNEASNVAKSQSENVPPIENIKKSQTVNEPINSNKDTAVDKSDKIASLKENLNPLFESKKSTREIDSLKEKINESSAISTLESAPSNAKNPENPATIDGKNDPTIHNSIDNQESKAKISSSSSNLQKRPSSTRLSMTKKHEEILNAIQQSQDQKSLVKEPSLVNPSANKDPILVVPDQGNDDKANKKESMAAVPQSNKGNLAKQGKNDPRSIIDEASKRADKEEHAPPTTTELGDRLVKSQSRPIPNEKPKENMTRDDKTSSVQVNESDKIIKKPPEKALKKDDPQTLDNQKQPNHGANTKLVPINKGINQPEASEVSPDVNSQLPLNQKPSKDDDLLPTESGPKKSENPIKNSYGAKSDVPVSILDSSKQDSPQKIIKNLGNNRRTSEKTIQKHFIPNIAPTTTTNANSNTNMPNIPARLPEKFKQNKRVLLKTADKLSRSPNDFQKYGDANVILESTKQQPQHPQSSNNKSNTGSQLPFGNKDTEKKKSGIDFFDNNSLERPNTTAMTNGTKVRAQAISQDRKVINPQLSKTHNNFRIKVNQGNNPDHPVLKPYPQLPKINNFHLKNNRLIISDKPYIPSNEYDEKKEEKVMLLQQIYLQDYIAQKQAQGKQPMMTKGVIQDANNNSTNGAAINTGGNPYDDFWTKKVLKHHYDIHLEPNIENNGTKWKVRRIKNLKKDNKSPNINVFNYDDHALNMPNNENNNVHPKRKFYKNSHKEDYNLLNIQALNKINNYNFFLKWTLNDINKSQNNNEPYSPKKAVKLLNKLHKTINQMLIPDNNQDDHLQDNPKGMTQSLYKSQRPSIMKNEIESISNQSIPLFHINFLKNIDNYINVQTFKKELLTSILAKQSVL